MDYSPDYIQTITSVEDMPPIAADIVSMYCQDHGIDENNIDDPIWDDIIYELYIRLFRPCNRLLKTDTNLYNQYDQSKVLYVYDNIYRRLCNRHCQEVLQKGFLDMTGIDKQTLYNWSEKATPGSFDLKEKISEDDEQSLSSLLKMRKGHPMKILPLLNYKFGYNMPGVKGEISGSGRKPQLTQAEVLAIEQADGPEADF